MEALEIKATPTAVKLMPDERLILRQKAKARARQIGIRFMGISEFMRWAALTVNVEQGANSTDTEPQRVAELA